jgi:DNA/RNA-binding domain of Phe-tRNA-synthetase-like protein
VTQTLFQYHPAILTQYPAVQGGLLYVTGLQNGVTPAPLLEQYAAEQATVNTRLPESLADLPSIAAWRGAFRQFGVNPTKVRCAAEALLRRLSKAGDIPSINTLVDIGNLVSIRYGLPVAIFDWRDVTGSVTVRPAVGNERFTELGADAPVAPEVDEVIFADETDMVLARRWCWRQSAESAARADTTTILVAIEAQHAAGAADVRAARIDLQALIATYCGGTIHSDQLNATHPVFQLPG